MSAEARRVRAVASVANGLGACGVKRSKAMTIAMQVVDDVLGHVTETVREALEAEERVAAGKPKGTVRAARRVVVPVDDEGKEVEAV